MMVSGATPRISQHDTVISGTSRRSSISGKRTSTVESRASTGMPCSANRAEYPRRASASDSPQQVRPATARVKPFPASHFKPSSMGSQVRAPRTASCFSRV